MDEQNAFTLINQQDGNLAFKMFTFTNNNHFDHLQRNNFYTLLWITKGNGLLKVDFSEYLFQENTIFAFSPYQPFLFSTNENICGTALQFHSDFYCIHRNPRETNCDMVLFNNIYQEPFFSFDKIAEEKFDTLFSQLKSEFHSEESDNYELLIPNLKIILVTASRIKAQAVSGASKFTDSETPFILHNLKTAIENNYKEKHSAGDYATFLNISTNALAKLVKANFNKTLTDLITERIVVEAKRELYMTTKPVKEIAWNLGYADESYFSRFFKVNTNISPQMYRDTVGFGKGESGMNKNV